MYPFIIIFFLSLFMPWHFCPSFGYVLPVMTNQAGSLTSFCTQAKANTINQQNGLKNDLKNQNIGRDMVLKNQNTALVNPLQNPAFTKDFAAQNPKAPKIAILYIATGRYIIFWDKFYEMMEQNFLPGLPKTYFIWTDAADKMFPSNVVRIYQPPLNWPEPTLKRYEMFKGKTKALEKYDYIFFINANMLPVRPVGVEIFPDENQGLTVVRHPGYYKAAPKDLPYDKNPHSHAYIPDGLGDMYVIGAFNGGTAKAYLKLIDELDQAIKKDDQNQVIARWHDESHLNKYILNKNPLVLSPVYGYPEDEYPSLNEFHDTYKMLILDKRKFGGHRYLRGQSNMPDK